jgi:uncharacterized membrane protein (Fun14 family)
MEDIIPPIIFMLIIGGVSGYFAGHLVKRVSGMALTIGVAAFIVIILSYTGNLDLNFDAITSNISNVLGIIAPLGIVALLSSVPFVASFVAGLFVGFRRH